MYRKEKFVKKVNAIIRAILWWIAGFACGMFIIAFCMWVNYFPETIIGEYALMLSPIILGVFSFLYTIIGDLYLFRKEW